VTTRKVSTQSQGVLRVLAVLRVAREPMHGDTIADRAYISRRTFSNSYYRVLLDAKLIHVAEWLRNVRGPYIPLYAYGKGPSVPKPQPKTNAEVSRNWKERTGYHEMRKAKTRLMRLQKQINLTILRQKALNISWSA